MTDWVAADGGSSVGSLQTPYFVGPVVPLGGVAYHNGWVLSEVVELGTGVHAGGFIVPYTPALLVGIRLPVARTGTVSPAANLLVGIWPMAPGTGLPTDLGLTPPIATAIVDLNGVPVVSSAANYTINHAIGFVEVRVNPPVRITAGTAQFFHFAQYLDVGPGVAVSNVVLGANRSSGAFVSDTLDTSAQQSWWDQPGFLFNPGGIDQDGFGYDLGFDRLRGGSSAQVVG